MKIESYYNSITSMKAELKTAGQIDKNSGSKSTDRAAELGKGFGSLLEKALIEPDGDMAVSRARAALADGSLDNQAACEDAATNLINQGI